jgi:hypothetical protein
MGGNDPAHVVDKNLIRNISIINVPLSHDRCLYCNGVISLIYRSKMTTHRLLIHIKILFLLTLFNIHNRQMPVTFFFSCFCLHRANKKCNFPDP